MSNGGRWSVTNESFNLDAAQVLAEPRVEIKGVCPGGTDPQGGTRDQGDHNVEQSVVNREYPPPCVRQSPLIRMQHEGHYHKGRGGTAARARASQARLAEPLGVREVAPPAGGPAPQDGRGDGALRLVPARDAR